MSPLMRLAALCLTVSAILAAADQPAFQASQRKWWAIQPVADPAPPSLDAAGQAWARNEIDHFIFRRLQEKGIRPSPMAAKSVYLRRVTLDLTGLPPTPAETQEYLSDSRPGAEERLIDRLLSTQRYGERWGRHWLDVVRYSDSDGFKQDDTRPNMWRYRDWVIRSFNEGKPFDRFIREQIAADELYPGNKDALPGLGYLRLFEDEFNQANVHLRRQELLNDVTDNTAFAFLGVTLACARCHDHKFDPLLHKDYYRFQAFFSNMKIDDEATTASPAEIEQHGSEMARYREMAKPVLDKIEALIGPAREKHQKRQIERFPPEVQTTILMKSGERTPMDWSIYHKAMTQVIATDADYAKSLDAAGKARFAELQKELAAFDKYLPQPLPRHQIMRDQDVSAPETHILKAGAVDAKLDRVEPGWLTILDPEPARVQPLPALNSSGRRSALANILADPKNPLSTRVIVNRVWHYHFGRGIAGNPNDLGIMGERPANPELLDWLTTRFTTTDGWDLKKLHKRILLSATYRQASDFRADAAEEDRSNRFLWRYPRRRLEAEAIRDSMLAVSGLLDRTMGGPGVFPVVPAGTEIQEGRHWKKPLGPADENRASVYIFARRLVRYPMLQSFDAPLAIDSCGRRQETVTPDQALEMMNGQAAARIAKALAARVANDAGQSPRALVERAIRLTYGREASAKELERGSEFLEKQSALAAGRQGALEDMCLSLLSSNEFLYID